MIRSLVFVTSLLTTAAVAQPPASVMPSDMPLARDIAAKLIPAGVYQRLMSGTMSQYVGSMTDQITTMPLAVFLKGTSVPQREIDRLGSTSIKQVMAILDPAYEQRMHIMTTIMFAELSKLMTTLEPSVREGLAEAYARHFSPAQLADIDHFLNTPSGGAFASQAIEIQADPAVMARMKALVPQMVQMLPAIMQKVQTATASLPKAKSAASLTAADREALAKLMGIPAAELTPKSTETTS